MTLNMTLNTSISKIIVTISVLSLIALPGCFRRAVQPVVGITAPKPVVATAAARGMSSSTKTAIGQCLASAQGGAFNDTALAAAGFSSSALNPRELAVKLPDGQGYSVTYPTEGAGGCKIVTNYPAFAPQLFAQSLSEIKLRGYDLRSNGGDSYTASNGRQALFVFASEGSGASGPRYEINITPAS